MAVKAGTDNKRQMVLAGVLGVFALIACYFLYNELFGGPASTPQAAAPVILQGPVIKNGGDTASGTVTGKTVSKPPGFVVGGEAARVGSGGTTLDPTLHMEAMLVTESLVYSGSGRNIFSGTVEAPPVKVVVASAPARPVQPTFVPPPAPTGPPPPPPINLKFFGTAQVPGGERRAFLLNGDDVFLASAGDVVQRRYKVISIAATSITVEDLPNSNRQTLPLVLN